MDGWNYKWYDAGGADAGHRWSWLGIVDVCGLNFLRQHGASRTMLQQKGNETLKGDNI